MDSPRTRLEQLLRQRHLTVDDFRAQYERLSGDALSARQAYRWVAGHLTGLPYPRAQDVVERMLGEPAAQVFGPPLGAGFRSSSRASGTTPPATGGRPDQLVATSAARARDFLRTAEATNVGDETIDQLADDVRRLAVAYPQSPLESVLDDIASTQACAFTFLEGRQHPEHSRALYLLAGVTSGLMAKASHDLGATAEAMIHARTAYACGSRAGRVGLCAWSRGVQSLVCYWSGRLADSANYSERGAARGGGYRGTSAVWLAVSRARALAALGRLAEARVAIERAGAIREIVQPDELDGLGGLCTFTRARQLYYAADALRWGGRGEAENTERLAVEAIDAYECAPDVDRAFGDEAGARCALAVARIAQGEIEGAAEAMAPVLQLPVAQRIHGIVRSVEHLQSVLARIVVEERAVAELGEALTVFRVERLALSR